MTNELDEKDEERDFLLRSLADLDAELAAGDIDNHDYLALKQRYERRLGAVERPPALGSAAPARPSAPRRPPPRWRTPAIVASVGALAVAAGLLVAHGSGQRLPGTTITGTVTPIGHQTELRIAQQDLSNGKYLDAVKIFTAVLRQDPRNPEALAYNGWVLRLTGSACNDQVLIDRGLTSIRAAEAAAPTYADAHFFAGEILLRDKLQGGPAADEFRQFLADNPPQAMVPEVQGELSAAIALAAASAKGSGATTPTTAAVPAGCSGPAAPSTSVRR